MDQADIRKRQVLSVVWRPLLLDNRSTMRPPSEDRPAATDLQLNDIKAIFQR